MLLFLDLLIQHAHDAPGEFFIQRDLLRLEGKGEHTAAGFTGFASDIGQHRPGTMGILSGMS